MTRIPYSRFLAMLGVASLSALASVGCRSTQAYKQGESAPTPVKSASGATTLAKTDFNHDATPEQAYNLHMELGRVRASESNFEAAATECQLALEVCEKKGSYFAGARLGADKQALAHRRMAESYDLMGRFAQADAHYSKALALTPHDPKVWNSAGYSYYIQNRLADAERALKMAAKYNPNDPKIQTNLGLALAAAGKTDEARAALTKAGGPAVGEANLGYILAAMGKKEEARKHYETAISLQPGLAPAREALAHLDIPKTDKALAIASATVSYPNDLPPLPAWTIESQVPKLNFAAPPATAVKIK